MNIQFEYTDDKVNKNFWCEKHSSYRGSTSFSRPASTSNECLLYHFRIGGEVRSKAGTIKGVRAGSAGPSLMGKVWSHALKESGQ